MKNKRINKSLKQTRKINSVKTIVLKLDLKYKYF